MAYLTLKKSLPANLIKKPIGVTTKKKITPITIGEITAPSNIPNLNHNRFNGVNNLEFSKPRDKKIIAMTNDQILIWPPLIKGQEPKIKNTKKKTKPKLLFELIFILDLFNIFFNFG